MTILKGYDSFLGIRAITGTALVNTTSAEWIFFNSMSFTRDQAISQVSEMGVGGRNLKRMQFGNVTAAGSFTKYVDQYNGIGLYRWLLAGSTTSASVGSTTYKHTFYEGNEVTDGGSVVRLQFEPQMGGNSATTRIWGVGLPDSYSLSVRPGELPSENWNFKLQEHGTVLNTVGTASFTMVNPINGTKSYLKMGETITTMSITNIQDFTLNISNNILENRCIGTTTVQNFQYGMKNVSGSFNMVFENYDLYNRFVNNTSTALQLVLESTLTDSGTTHSVNFLLPECFLTGAHPQVGDMGQIIQPINFVANYGSSAGYQIKIEVYNTSSTIGL